MGLVDQLTALARRIAADIRGKMDEAENQFLLVDLDTEQWFDALTEEPAAPPRYGSLQFGSGYAFSIASMALEYAIHVLGTGSLETRLVIPGPVVPGFSPREHGFVRNPASIGLNRISVRGITLATPSTSGPVELRLVARADNNPSDIYYGNQIIIPEGETIALPPDNSAWGGVDARPGVSTVQVEIVEPGVNVNGLTVHAYRHG